MLKLLTYFVETNLKKHIMLNIDITTIKNEKDRKKIDKLINSETQRKISAAIPGLRVYDGSVVIIRLIYR